MPDPPRARGAKLPARLSLPSGDIVELRRAGDLVTAGESSALFDDARAALSTCVLLTKKGAPVDVVALPLRDFHVLRAVLTKAGILVEEEIEIACRNCAAPLRVRPCAELEIGPWVDGEADDEELDTTLPFGEPIDVPEIPLGRVRTAYSVTFEDRTVDEARASFAAARKEPLVIDAELVRAKGIVALGAERDPAKIAEALAACDDDAFAAVSTAYLASHYVARLMCVVFCEACGARNDVDAPYVREDGGFSELDREVGRGGGLLPDGAPLPDFDAFAARAREIAEPMMVPEVTRDIELVIDAGTPAVDDGGEPLLGSYLPPHAGDPGTVARPPTVTVYYRTFEAMWKEEGPFDWEDELTETIEHELEHHVYFLRGDDPMDDEERGEIRAEAVRIVGRRETGRRALEGFGASWRDFLMRTWPLWVLALVALAAMLATQD